MSTQTLCPQCSRGEGLDKSLHSMLSSQSGNTLTMRDSIDKRTTVHFETYGKDRLALSAPGQTINKRTPLTRLPQQALSVLLAQSGYSFGLIADAIAEQSGTQITRQQVGFDVATVIEQHRQLCPTDPEEARILQIARLEMISNLALQGFLDSSTVDSTTVSQDVSDKTDKDADRPKRRTQTRTKKAGDAKFLAIMQGIEVERSKILGVYAPERKEEVGQLTVTFAWSDSPQLPQTPAQDAEYTILADSETPQTDPE